MTDSAIAPSNPPATGSQIPTIHPIVRKSFDQTWSKLSRVNHTEAPIRGTVEDPETMDAHIYEQDKQRRLYEELVGEGYTIADDPANLEKLIGQTADITVICEMWTPRLLCKLFVKGTEHIDHSFHLVPLHQIVKWLYQVPNPGETFSGKFVIGVRRVGEGKYVPALRLPLK